MAAHWLLLLALVALHMRAVGSAATPELLNFEIYASPSGHYQFEAQSPLRKGVGPGTCKLSKDGRHLWESKLSFCFSEALVTDQGTVAGYGYTAGKAGITYQGGDRGAEDLCVAILGPDGKQRLAQPFPRAMSLSDDAREWWAAGMFVSDDRFTVRISNSQDSELWLNYQLSTGKPLGVTKPPRPIVQREAQLELRRAVPVAGTPLVLVHWWVVGPATGESGAVFNLIDSNGKKVWDLDAPRDYQTLDQAAGPRLLAVLDRDGAIFKTAKSGHFELWLARRGERVLYSVIRKGERWLVAEVSHREYDPVPSPEYSVPATTPPPQKLGNFTLDSPPPAGPVQDVSTFAFDARGRIGFLRGRDHFVLIEPGGQLLAEVPLNLPPKVTEDGEVLLAWIAGNRWLVVPSDWAVWDDQETNARAWWIDAEKKTVAEIPGFTCPPIRALAGAGDGGFVALAKDVANPAFCSMLVAFDAAAKPRWKMAANQDFTPESFFAPKGVLVTPRGEVAVFDDIRKTIHLYDRDGKHLHTVDLEKAWKRDPGNPSRITADAASGFIVGDMSARPPFVSMTADGTVRGEFSPKFKDGGIPDWPGELHVAPDGRKWINNLHNLVRLDDTAVVDRIVGIQLDADTLGIIGTAACDAKGHIYAADEQTGAVHVFDADGHKLHVCKPTKTDVPGNLRSTNLTVTDGGRVFLRGRGSDPNFVVFGPDGTRERTVPAGEGFCEWYSRRGSAGMWILNYRDITLTDEKLALGRQIERWPDHSWIESPYSAAVAQDGSLAVLEGNESTASSLGFFSPQGTPQRSLRVPFERTTFVGWNGSHFVIRDDMSSIIICDREGRPVRLLHLQAKASERAQFLTHGGRELWILEFATRKVTRYAMPPP